MMAVSDQKFDLVAAKLESLKAQMIDQLNRELFRVGTITPVAPPTWRERLSWKMARVRGYFATLWDALRGRDPYDADEDY